MLNRLVALGLLALGALGIYLSVQSWQPCYTSTPTSPECLQAMSDSSHLTVAFALWWAAIALAAVGAFAPVGRWPSVIAVVFLLTIGNPVFDPGLGRWDTADVVPGTGIIAASMLIVAGLIVGIGEVVDARRARRHHHAGAAASPRAATV